MPPIIRHVRKFLFISAANLAYHVIDPFCTWCYRQAGRDSDLAPLDHRPWVETDESPITLFLLNAVVKEQTAIVRLPESAAAIARQRDLNRCLELTRGDLLKGWASGMLASLLQEQTMQEAMLQVIANFMMLGVELGKRLASPFQTAATPEQTTADPTPEETAAL